MFYKYVHILGSKGSLDMIMTAFDGKLDEKKDEIFPRACRPSTNLKKNNADKVDHQTVETKTMSKKWVHIMLYTFIYIQIPSYTSKQLYIPSYTPTYIQILNIRKIRANINPENDHKWDPSGSPWPEFGMHLPTIPPKVFPCPKGLKIN